MDMPEAEMKWVVCDTCGKDVPCNAAYPVSQITCFRCRIEKKWREQENARKQLALAPDDVFMSPTG